MTATSGFLKDHSCRAFVPVIVPGTSWVLALGIPGVPTPGDTGNGVLVDGGNTGAGIIVSLTSPTHADQVVAPVLTTDRHGDSVVTYTIMVIPVAVNPGVNPAAGDQLGLLRAVLRFPCNAVVINRPAEARAQMNQKLARLGRETQENRRSSNA